MKPNAFFEVSRNTFEKMTEGLDYHWILMVSPPVCDYYDSAGELVARMFDEFMGTPPEYYVTEAYMKSWHPVKCELPKYEKKTDQTVQAEPENICFECWHRELENCPKLRGIGDETENVSDAVSDSEI